ncbi:MAG: hypothetical protein KF862_06045 [Chitinophagaceae bacterium]|nr:hypothetical protein [Chitinophagaceae bacterium]
MSNSNNNNDNKEKQTTLSEKINEPSSDDAISKKDRIDIKIKIATLIFTATAVIATFATYFATQKWKKAEFTYSTVNSGDVAPWFWDVDPPCLRAI